MEPEKNIDEILDRYITSASTEDVESHCDRVFQLLQSQTRDTTPHARPYRQVNCGRHRSRGRHWCLASRGCARDVGIREFAKD